MVKHGEKNTRNRISELPDDVLTKILSVFIPEEALLKTGFQSHRWKQLWEFWPSILVLKDSKQYMNERIEIEMRKNGRKLELDIPPLRFGDLIRYHLSFPQERFSGIQFLKRLCLKHVAVTDESFGWILSNCPVLETLRVEKSPQLRRPKVSGSSLRLKHLHISECIFVSSLEISAPNLVSFEYCEKEFGPMDLVIRYAPKLTELHYSCSNDYHIPILACHLSSYVPQLVSMTLNLALLSTNLPAFPEFTGLRHLTCEVTLPFQITFLLLKSLIEASPFLHEFKLEITKGNVIKRELGEVPKVEGYPHKHPHECLKEVQIIGFSGQPMEAEFVTYLLKGGIKLEKMEIHTPCLNLLHWGISYSTELVETTHRMAQKLAHQLIENRPRDCTSYSLLVINEIVTFELFY